MFRAGGGDSACGTTPPYLRVVLLPLGTAGDRGKATNGEDRVGWPKQASTTRRREIGRSIEETRSYLTFRDIPRPESEIMNPLKKIRIKNLDQGTTAHVSSPSRLCFSHVPLLLYKQQLT